jgi:glycosyltransferase involved in cell wall biosynthesis
MRRAADPRVVFTGAMRHAPNADGARWYLDHVHPMVAERIPSLRVAIVGADPPPDLRARQSAGVEVTGRVDDIRPWLANASVAIVPLLSGGGTRLKILEAMAAGIPVVSTTVGAEGLDLADGSDLLIADSPRAFADAILRVLYDSSLAESLSERGRVTVLARFDWRVVVERLISAHDEAIQRFHEAQLSR